jgi:Rrf2 family protein
MITQTSELALRALLLLALEAGDEPSSPRQLAERLDCSQSYLAKVMGMLVKARLLRSFRGAKGGVLLALPPEEISLKDVVEACEGVLVGNYCRSLDVPGVAVCAFHQAMSEVHRATVSTLARWTLADLVARPTPEEPNTTCKMRFAGWEEHFPGARKS